MHTRGEWKAEAAGNEVIVTAGGRFIAFFEADEDAPQEPEEVLGNARRAAACVNACEGLENPAHQIRTLQADSGYLARYRDAYCASVMRQDAMAAAIEALRAEVRVMRQYAPKEICGDVGSARRAVDEARALVEPKLDDRTDLSRYKGLDVRNVQLLIGAVEALIASRRVQDGIHATAIVGLPEFARLVGVLTECKDAPKVEDVR